MSLETELLPLVDDINDALPSDAHRNEFSRRIDEATLAVALRMAWQCKDAPTLAQRVRDLQESIGDGE